MRYRVLLICIVVVIASLLIRGAMQEPSEQWELRRCTTDTECKELFGGNGDPDPKE
jgi:hypothetical protein